MENITDKIDMKYLILSLLILTASVSYAKNETQTCGFEGNKWDGNRKFTQSCEQNYEKISCANLAEVEGGPYAQSLSVCHCIMKHSEFFKRHNAAIDYRQNRLLKGMEKYLPDYDPNLQGYNRVRDGYKRVRELCTPFKAVEVKLGDETVMAIYSYNKETKRCVLETTRMNRAAVSERFNMPGATNWSELLRDAIVLTAAITKHYNGPLELSSISDQDASRGHLNCSGTASEFLEQVASEERAKIDKEREDQRSTPASETPATTNSANVNVE